MFYHLHKPENDVQRIKDKRRIQPNVPLTEANTTDWYGRFRLVQGADNDYLLDRDAQRSGRSFTGITGVFSEDHAITESMGPVLDRSNEHVGTSDVMVIRIRRRLLDAAEALVEKNLTPPGVDEPEVYRTRSASCVLPAGVDWLEATEELRRAEY
jgi:phthalate 4,5-dioxygenase